MISVYIPSSVSAVTDVVLAVVPVFILRSLELNGRTKITARATMVSGSLSCSPRLLPPSLSKMFQMQLSRQQCRLWSDQVQETAAECSNTTGPASQPLVRVEYIPRLVHFGVSKCASLTNISPSFLPLPFPRNQLISHQQDIRHQRSPPQHPQLHPSLPRLHPRLPSLSPASAAKTVSGIAIVGGSC